MHSVTEIASLQTVARRDEYFVIASLSRDARATGSRHHVTFCCTSASAAGHTRQRREALVTYACRMYLYWSPYAVHRCWPLAFWSRARVTCARHITNVRCTILLLAFSASFLYCRTSYACVRKFYEHTHIHTHTSLIATETNALIMTCTFKKYSL